MAFKAIFLVAISFYIVEPVAGQYVEQSNLTFAFDNSRIIWETKDILGNSTQFDYPVSMGTSMCFMFYIIISSFFNC